jgi:hypothetical protein
MMMMMMMGIMFVMAVQTIIKREREGEDVTKMSQIDR